VERQRRLIGLARARERVLGREQQQSLDRRGIVELAGAVAIVCASRFMPGGKSTLDPAPIPAPADPAAKSAYYGAPYFTRPRNLLIDDTRGVADYQRPVIDLLPNQTGYVGLWEIVEVTVDDSSYEVDGIKSAIQIAILKAFRAAGIELSPPQDVRLIGGAPQAKNA